jgi:glutathione S-transferase
MVKPAAKLHSPPFGGTNMMMEHRWTALVSLLALLVYFWMSLQVARARGKSGIDPPAMTGDPLLERAVRVQSNTLEWLPLFLVSLWLFAIYWNELVAAGMGLVWIVGRLLYSAGYMADPAKRSTGFLIQLLACAVLLLGALGKILYGLATGGV